MLRLGVIIALVALIACGDNLPVSIDAANISVDAPMADASTCAMPDKLCGMVCTRITADEDNCGDCGISCRGGEACSGTCACPAPFVPAIIDGGNFDQFLSASSATVAVAPLFAANGINPILVGYTATTPLDSDIDLSTIPVGDAPFVAAGYGFDLGTMLTDAGYLVTAGTLRLTTACDTEAEGTLTNATFHGVTGGLMNAQIDPLGCEFAVASLAFHIMTSPCP